MKTAQFRMNGEEKGLVRWGTTYRLNGGNGGTSAKELAIISKDIPLDVLGLSSGGLGQKDRQQELEELLSSAYPNLAKT
uniref:Uncharacterized protein n=1 Tax=Glossina austeni TaxID=7395 RepID=A0A1A9UJB8_GLOAU